jgi:hypothetical protein
LVIGPILSLYRINGSLAVISADVGRKPCKRNDSFFQKAGKPRESRTMMWIKSRRHLHSRNADDARMKPAAAMRNRQRNQPPSEDEANEIATDSVSNQNAAGALTRLPALGADVIITLTK